MEKKRILIVDDDESLIELLTINLSSKNYEIITATDGKEGLDLARKERPDLILLDVMLPSMDGYHVAAEISKRMGRWGPKIVIMTSRSLKMEGGAAIMSGATDMIQKPFKLAELNTKVAKILDKRPTLRK